MKYIANANLKLSHKNYRLGQVVDISDFKNAKSMIESGYITTVGDVDATNAAKQLAQENNINLVLVVGTGSNGRILKSDVENFINGNQ